MLRRIAVVSWWLGAIMAGLVAFVLLAQVNDRADCDGKIALANDIDNKYAAAEARRPKKQVSEQTSSLSAFDAIASDLAAVPRDPRDSDDLRQKVKSCQAGLNYTSIVLLLLTAIFWIVSFILGGSFWIPPKKGQ